MLINLMQKIFAAVFWVFIPCANAIQDVNHIVAIVDEDVIVRTELDESIRTISNQMRKQQVAIPPQEILERQILERMIIQHLQLQLAGRSGIKIDEETLATTISNIARRNNASLAEFRATLERDGYTFDYFREEIRKQLIIGRLQQREVANHITVTDQEVNDFLASRRSQGDDLASEGEWHIAQILVAIPEGASPERIQTARKKAENLLAQIRAGEDFQALAISQSDARDALEGGDLGWRRRGQIPSLFVDQVVEMQRGDLIGPLRSPAGFHLIKLLDYRGQISNTITQTRARHILIRTGENTSDEDAHNRLAQLRLRIQNGENFGELARAHSEDSATVASQGSLGWINQGDSVSEFDEVMNKLAINAVSEPFKTPLGWHIVQVLERRQRDNTQDNLRAKALEAIRSRKIEEGLDSWLRRLREEAYIEIRLDTEIPNN